MRVLYIHQHFNTPEGSVGTRSYEFSKRLVNTGHEVTVICGSYGTGNTGLKTLFIRGKRDGFVQGIRVIEFDLEYSNNDGLRKRTWTFVKFALHSIKLVFTEKYDVLFATTTPLTAGIPGIFARWFRGKPFVFEVRDLWPELPEKMGIIKNPIILGLMSALEWASYHSAHRCVALSPGIVDGIAKRGVDRSKIAMIPNCCDLEVFSAGAVPWRPEGVLEDDFMAIYTGTHGIANGLDAALDAALELKQRGRDDIKLVLVGEGKLKQQLQKRAQEMQLDNVIFHSLVSKTRLAGLMAEADMGMQLLANVPAFYYGTSPNKFFDYISAGLPVLNNYPGWLAGIIEENQCGFVVPPNNPKAFATALESAAINRSELRVMSSNARNMAERSFSREDLADKWIQWVAGAGK
jgi:glycosyltransferase involved in cell wall biosynthesis